MIGAAAPDLGRVGRWTAFTALQVRWFATGKTVKGAHGAALKLTKRLQGTRISVRVIGSKAGYAALTRAAPRPACGDAAL